MSTITDLSTPSTQESAELYQNQDEIELQVQRILTELEEMSPEVQGRFCSRLLSAIADKLTPAISGKALSLAKKPPTSANQKTNSKSQGSKASTKGFRTHLESQLTVLQDSSDPIEAWYYFGGADELLKVLREEPEGTLEIMLRHQNMPYGTKPRGKSSEVLAKNIIQRLSVHFSK